ncbi:hypothetical protein [Rhizobium sp. LjRoot254]|uniref:hypothetical protein n=1 Tax=Rhizobium sp. LjRoot254 TaxID=3342297 RepID=UPI003ECFDC1A
MTKTTLSYSTRMLATAELNGARVSFFEPPHSEPDFPWVDLRELTAAVCPPSLRAQMVRNAAKICRGVQQPVLTVTNGFDEIEIVSHLTAQAVCATIDELETGCPDPHGLAEEAFLAVAFDTYSKCYPMTVEEVVAAMGNLGGSFGRPAH